MHNCTLTFNCTLHKISEMQLNCPGLRLWLHGAFQLHWIALDIIELHWIVLDCTVLSFQLLRLAPNHLRRHLVTSDHWIPLWVQWKWKLMWVSPTGREVRP